MNSEQNHQICFFQSRALKENEETRSIAPTRIVHNTDLIPGVEDGKAYIRLVFRMANFLKKKDMMVLMMVWTLVQGIPHPEARKLQNSVRRQIANKIKGDPEYCAMEMSHKFVFNEFINDFEKFYSIAQAIIAQGLGNSGS